MYLLYKHNLKLLLFLLIIQSLFFYNFIISELVGLPKMEGDAIWHLAGSYETFEGLKDGYIPPGILYSPFGIFFQLFNSFLYFIFEPSY